MCICFNENNRAQRRLRPRRSEGRRFSEVPGEICGGVADGDAVIEAVVEEAFLFQCTEVFDEGAVEAAGVEEEDAFVVYLQLVPGEHFKEFVEGAEAAGQDNGGVAMFVHHFFADVHIGYGA